LSPKHRGIRAKEGDRVGKLMTAYLRKAEERDLGRIIVESHPALNPQSVRRWQGASFGGAGL
jgi:hypothetical protein